MAETPPPKKRLRLDVADTVIDLKLRINPEGETRFLEAIRQGKIADVSSIGDKYNELNIPCTELDSNLFSPLDKVAEYITTSQEQSKDPKEIFSVTDSMLKTLFKHSSQENNRITKNNYDIIAALYTDTDSLSTQNFNLDLLKGKLVEKKLVNRSLALLQKDEAVQKAMHQVFDMEKHPIDRDALHRDGYQFMPPYTPLGLLLLKQCSKGMASINDSDALNHFRVDMEKLDSAITGFVAGLLGDLNPQRKLIEGDKAKKSHADYPSSDFYHSVTSGAFLHKDIPEEAITAIIPGEGTKYGDNQTISAGTCILPRKFYTTKFIASETIAADTSDEENLGTLYQIPTPKVRKSHFVQAPTQIDEEGNRWTRGVVFSGGAQNPSREELKNERGQEMPAMVHTTPPDNWRDFLKNSRNDIESKALGGRTTHAIHFNVM